jgi:hypothetical protein
MSIDPNCENCEGTGFYGDNGPGISKNSEYQRCECAEIDSEKADTAVEADTTPMPQPTELMHAAQNVREWVMWASVEIQAYAERIAELEAFIGDMCSHTDGGCSKCPINAECDAPGKDD